MILNLCTFENYAKNTLPVVGIIYFSILSIVKKSLIFRCESFHDFDLIATGRRAGNLKEIKFNTSILQKDLSCIGPKFFNKLPNRKVRRI